MKQVTPEAVPGSKHKQNQHRLILLRHGVLGTFSDLVSAALVSIYITNALQHQISFSVFFAPL